MVKIIFLKIWNYFLFLDSAYTERYMLQPSENAQGYDVSESFVNVSKSSLHDLIKILNDMQGC